jgi:hypothetical protein
VSFLSKIGSKLKAVAKPLAKATTWATAPIRVGVTAPLKLATAGAVKLGAPVKILDAALGKQLKSDVSAQIDHIKIGAAAGTALVTGGGSVAMVTAGASKALEIAAAKPKAPAAPVMLTPAITTAPSMAGTKLLPPPTASAPALPAPGATVRTPQSTDAPPAPSIASKASATVKAAGGGLVLLVLAVLGLLLFGRSKRAA